MHPVWKYTAMQVPQGALIAAAAFGLSWALGWAPWVPWALLGVWIVKEVAIYPFVRDSLVDGPDRVGAGRLIGELGVARDPLAPSGYVSVRGERWRAERPRHAPDIPAGAPVRVRAVDGLLLHVEPE